MQTCRVNGFDELAALSDAWNRLAGDVPFRRFEWLGTWWRHYQPAMSADGRRVELYALKVMDGGKLIGLAPWYIERSRTAGSIIRLLGTGEVCSDYLSVIARADRRMDVAVAIADWLTKAGRAARTTDDRWDILELANLDACDEMGELLAGRLHERGADLHTREAVNTWRIQLPPTMEEFLSLLSKSHRKQLRQLQRRFFETGQAVLRTVNQADQIDTGWQILSELHQRRLESLGKRGCFKSETFAQFHRAATNAMYRAGRLHLHWLELNARPIAAEYHLAGDEVMFAYQGGIEPDALDYEPGRLITLVTLERALDSGYRAFDFCRGDEPYKPHWRAEPRKNVSWRIACNRVSARLRHSLWIGGQSARKWMKSGLQLAMRKFK